MVEKQDFEALIVRYLEGSATPEEAMQLEDWMKESKENQKMYDHYESLFAENKFQKVDANAAWKKVHSEISAKTKIVPFKNWRYWSVAVAAILVVALIIPGLLDDKPDIDQVKPQVAVDQEQENILFAKNGVQSFILDDQSVVALADGSSLELSKDFAKGVRSGTLKGSGKFTVVHDEEHPFLINVEGLEVHDIGTVFDIKTHNDTVKVVVLEGAVELRKNGQLLSMEKGDSAFYLISEQLIKEYPTKESLKGIVIRFSDVPLKDIVLYLSNYFKRDMIIMNEKLKEKKFFIEFNGQELPEALMLLELNDLRIVKKNNKIEIYDAK